MIGMAWAASEPAVTSREFSQWLRAGEAQPLALWFLVGFPFQEEKLKGMQEASLDSSSPGSEGEH